MPFGLSTEMQQSENVLEADRLRSMLSHMDQNLHSMQVINIRYHSLEFCKSNEFLSFFIICICVISFTLYYIMLCY